MRRWIGMSLAATGIATALVAIPGVAMASTTCSGSLSGNSASYWNCSTTDGWHYFRAVAPCYQGNTREHWTAYGSWVAISNKTTHSTASCAPGVRQGNPTIQLST